MRRWPAVRMAAVLALALAAGVAAAGDDGAVLYEVSCASCHGSEGRGDGPDASLLASPPRNLRDGVLRRYDDEALVRRIRDGRALALPVDPKALRARVADVDELVAHLRRIPAIDWPAVRVGELVYARHCERCHGIFGEAPAAGPLDLASPRLQARLDPAALRTLLRQGHAGVPGLEPGEERDLIAFVRVLSPGALRYFRYCAPCHGDDGRPPADLPPTLDRPAVSFDAAYLHAAAPRDLDTAVWHMIERNTPRMPHLRAELSEAQVRAIVAHLRALDAPGRR